MEKGEREIKIEENKKSVSGSLFMEREKYVIIVKKKRSEQQIYYIKPALSFSYNFSFPSFVGAVTAYIYISRGLLHGR